MDTCTALLTGDGGPPPTKGKARGKSAKGLHSVAFEKLADSLSGDHAYKHSAY